MTDNDIIKALEYHSKENEDCFGECPYENYMGMVENNCVIRMTKDALDLINRQKAEIERLHNILLSFTNEVHTWSNRKGYDTTELSLIPILNEAESVREAIRAEAIIEFEQKVFDLFPADKNHTTISRFTIKQIAKEMKEGVNNA